MAGSLNRAQLIGHLGRDLEVRNFQNGNKVCNLRIATSTTWKDRDSGERKERTEWHTVAIFADGLVRIAEQYLSKGSKVMIEGQLETRKWQDQSGQDRYSTEIVLRPYSGQMIMLGSGSGTGQRNDQSHDRSPSDYGMRDQEPPGSGRHHDIDDEIPF